jgi:6,7-dimethyl-8-ribityllumazine synthase
VTKGGARRAEGSRRGDGMRIAVVVSRFNQPITERLRDGAVAELERCGVDPQSVVEVWVPGAFELPLAAHRLATSGEVEAVVCLGAVVKGDTDHYTHVAAQCAWGLQRVQLDTGVPCVFGVLTTETQAQAEDRAGGAAGNKGEEAAATAVEMADVLRQLPKSGPGGS